DGLPRRAVVARRREDADVDPADVGVREVRLRVAARHGERLLRHGQVELLAAGQLHRSVGVGDLDVPGEAERRAVARGLWAAPVEVDPRRQLLLERLVELPDELRSYDC